MYSRVDSRSLGKNYLSRSQVLLFCSAWFIRSMPIKFSEYKCFYEQTTRTLKKMENHMATYDTVLVIGPYDASDPTPSADATKIRSTRASPKSRGRGLQDGHTALAAAAQATRETAL